MRINIYQDIIVIAKQSKHLKTFSINFSIKNSNPLKIQHSYEKPQKDVSEYVKN